MKDAEHIRKLMEALDERAAETGYVGKHADNPNITYDAEQKGGEINKVIARLTSDPSGRYTKLGRNLLRIGRITERINEMKAEVKQDTRDLIADLFNADDACRTREVDTISFIFQLTADPKPTETYKYKEVLDELSEFLTPALLEKKKEILAKFKSTVQKAPSLRITKDKAEESLEEGGLGDLWKTIKTSCRKFLRGIMAWGVDYDHRLDMLKAQVAMGESIVDEAGAGPFLDTGRGHADIKWGRFLTRVGYHLGNKLGIAPRTTYDDGDKWAEYLRRERQVQQRKESIEEESNPLREDDFDFGDSNDWHSQDDLADYNNAEADDYRHEYDDDDDDDEEPNIDPDLTTYSPEDAVATACDMMQVDTTNQVNVEAIQNLVRELNRYSDIYSISPTQNDQAYDFDVADSDNVNHNYNPMATAWLDASGRFCWKS